MHFKNSFCSMYSLFFIADQFLLCFKAFTMEILRHKDTIDELVKSGDKIMNTCTEEEKQTIKVKFHKFAATVDVKIIYK